MNPIFDLVAKAVDLVITVVLNDDSWIVNQFLTFCALSVVLGFIVAAVLRTTSVHLMSIKVNDRTNLFLFKTKPIGKPNGKPADHVDRRAA